MAPLTIFIVMSKERHKNRGGHNKVNLENLIFGKLRVIKDTGIRKSRRPIWECKCECGNTINVLGKYLLCGDTKSCGCFLIGNAHNRTGFKLLSGSYWGSVLRQAKLRGIPVSITAEDAYNQYIKQNKKCALSNVEITFSLNLRDDRSKQTASLDRIDNSIGYTKENIQWVHKKINIMRNTMSISELKDWCKKIINQ